MNRTLRDRIAMAGLLCGCALASVPGARAAPVAEPSVMENVARPSEFAERLLIARVNGAQIDEPALVVLHDGRVYARAADFERWRLTPPATAGISFNNETYLPLDAVKGLSYTVDESTQELIITGEPEIFSSTVVGRSDVEFKTPPPAPPGGFFNYDLNYLHQDDDETLNGLFELGVFNGLGVASSTFLGQESEFDDRYVRLETTYIRDLPVGMSSIRAGDSIGRPGAWGRAVRFGGFQWTTNFATQPAFIPFPLPTLIGETVLPSTVELYADNAQRLSQDVPPGPFTIPNVPLVTGAGDVQLVVTDILGRQQVITQPYYVSQNLLREGLSDYSFELGAVREDFGLDSNDYGDVFAAGTWRHGFSQWFTGEGRLELLDDQQTAGLSGSYLWPALGTLNATVAGSTSGDEQGGLVGFGMDRQAQLLSFGLQTEFTTEDFEQLGLLNDLPPPRQRTFARVGFPLGNLGRLSLNYTHLDNRAFEDSEFVTAGYSTSLWSRCFLSVFGLKDVSGESDDSVSVVLTVPLGSRTTASANYSASNGDNRAGLQLQRNLPVGNGYGYRLLTETGDNARDQASLLAQSSVGTYSAEAARFDGENAYRLGAAGGVALLGRRGFATRWIDDSFGVARVSEYENVTVYAENQPIATTGESGYALIPRLRAYQNNSISIEQADLPLDAQIGALRLDATPWFRSGVLIDFPVRPLNDALLTIVLEDGTPLPSGASAELVASGEEFPVALRGEAYVTGLDAEANNVIKANWRGQICFIDVELPADAGPLPVLGPFVCEGVKREPSEA